MHLNIKKTALMCLIVFFFISAAPAFAEKKKLVLEIPQGFNCKNLQDAGLRDQCYEVQANQKPLVPDKVVAREDCSVWINNPREYEVCTRRDLLIALAVAKTASRHRRDGEDKYGKEARKQIEKEEKQKQQQDMDFRGAFIRARVQGCQEGTVTVYPKAAQNPSLFIYATIPVVNRSDRPVSISYGNEIVVENLCAGGSMILTKRLEPWNHGITPLRYTAVGQGKGSAGISQYYGNDLFICQGQPCQIFRPQQPWDIRLY